MRTLGWLLFIILCAQALSSLAIEIFRTAKHHMPEGLNAVNGITSLPGGRGERQNELKQANFYPVKRQKGKGSYGGANIDHRPRPVRSAASLPKKSLFSILSTTILCAGFTLVLVLPSSSL
ncbi:hypothetical protein Acr_16g0006390 [Actinidia rufa]|uniref:Uncharacterized protein n=1 Tax=Actinidia rufa TaxID=165716 RepID=A0A7J0FZ85_9ERIC|nr:hypothetical protein Acr_16g0006390 [Actinidia rufa]